ncbi:MAG: hypothetical protein BMS9Abin28_1094 [Anaerolineae bacterium]|nr:MAG: hypothetical protein BMS9Abin28_1094 [Anaerolineae bacterium]
MTVKKVPAQARLLSEWEQQPMDRDVVAPAMLNSGPVTSRGLTQRMACDILPQLKASALWSPDGLEMEGTVSMVPVGDSSESLSSCSLATIRI